MNATKETKDENKKLHSFNDEPAIVYDSGSMYWFKHGKLHRDNDLPAIIHYHGTKRWYQHDKRHRETDAAVICPDGHKEYWLNRRQYTFDEWIKLTPIPEEDKIALVLEK